MIMYRARHSFGKVQLDKVEIERQTKASFYLTDGTVERKRVIKHGYIQLFFVSHLEAKNWLIEESENMVGNCRRNLQIAQSTLGNAKGLKP